MSKRDLERLYKEKRKEFNKIAEQGVKDLAKRNGLRGCDIEIKNVKIAPPYISVVVEYYPENTFSKIIEKYSACAPEDDFNIEVGIRIAVSKVLKTISNILYE